MRTVRTQEPPEVLPFHPTSAEEIIVRVQEILAAYSEPRNGISDRDVINRLLEVLDGPAALEIYENVIARRPGGYREGPQQH
jgi:hypothetical protein